MNQSLLSTTLFQVVRTQLNLSHDSNTFEVQFYSAFAVPHPYTFLNSSPAERKWFTVLILKNASFCISLDGESWLFFAFK